MNIRFASILAKAGFVLFAIAFTAAIAAAATPSMHTVIESNGGFVTFYSSDPAQNTETWVTIIASDTTQTDPISGTSNRRYLEVIIDINDTNHNDDIDYIDGTTEDFQFSIDPNFKYATLTARIPVTLSSGEETEIVVNTQLNTQDKPQRGSTRSVVTQPYYHAVGQTTWAMYPCEASGTVYIGSTNYTPLPSVGAELDHNIQDIFEKYWN